MHISVFDLFKIGIGPSSSHTVGPMNAARRFAQGLADGGLLPRVTTVKAELFGSLGFTGKGHCSDLAVMLGLEGEEPRTVDIDTAPGRVEKIIGSGTLSLLGKKTITFKHSESLIFHRREKLPLHSNGMRFTAFADGEQLFQRIYYSVGGGFVINDKGAPEGDNGPTTGHPLPYPFSSGDTLLAQCNTHGLSISTLMLENEKSQRTPEQIRTGLLELAAGSAAPPRSLASSRPKPTSRSTRW